MGIISTLTQKLWPVPLPQAVTNGSSEFVDMFRREDSPIDANRLDGSPASLKLVDEVLDDYRRQKVELPSDILLLTSAYVFEVVRGRLGGSYQRSDDGSQIALVIGAPDFRLAVLAMARVAGHADGSGPAGLGAFLAEAEKAAAEKRDGEVS